MRGTLSGMTVAEFIVSVKWPLLFLIILLAVLFAAMWSRAQDMRQKRWEHERKLGPFPPND